MNYLALAIEPLEHETHYWVADNDGMRSRSAMARASGYYTSAIVPPVARLDLELPTDLIADIEEAAAELALDTYRDGDARPIVERFSDASRYAARTGISLVDDLADQLTLAAEQLGNLRSNAIAWKVLPYLVAHPVINTPALNRILGTANYAAQRALTQLTDAGVLEERTGKLRGRVWQHSGILAVLDRYAESIRRR